MEGKYLGRTGQQDSTRINCITIMKSKGGVFDLYGIDFNSVSMK